MIWFLETWIRMIITVSVLGFIDYRTEGHTLAMIIMLLMFIIWLCIPFYLEIKRMREDGKEKEIKI